MISSIYIPKNSFNFLFDTIEEGLTLNLGGKSLFEFVESEKIVRIRRRVNDDYIENFWNNGIANITAIVGKNGSGKTSLMRSISGLDVMHKNCIYIFENSHGEIRILNQTEKTIQYAEDYTDIKSINRIATLYYSPVIDFDLVGTRSPITLVNHFKRSAEDYKLRSTARNIRLMNSSTIEKLHQVYSDFPVYDKIILKASILSKDFFLNPYLQSNFANPHTGDSVINTIIDPELARLKEWNDNISPKRVADILQHIKKSLKAESFSQQFNKIWELKYYKNTKNDKIHDGTNFLRNLEVSILSYLMLNSVYVLRGLEGRYTDYSFLNNDNDFRGMLNGFIGNYIDNVNGVWYTLIIDKFREIDVSGIDDYLDYMKADKIFSIGDIKAKDLKIDISNRLGLISNFYNLHSLFAEIIGDAHTYVDSVELDIHMDLEQIEAIVNLYDRLIQFTRGIPVELNILDFLPNKMLSNGEKSLIDLYASLHTYLKDNRHNSYVAGEGVLLLLDEAELGYHPIWKRKFINALNDTLPVLFADTVPKTFNDETKEYEIIEGKYPVQVVFTTHDALTLSDMPQDKIIYLNKLDDSSNVILEKSDKKTFGANVFDLFKESFFIDDLLIGDFANKKIDQVIQWINYNKDIEKRNENFNSEFENNKLLLNLIDEPILKTKLLEMMDELKDSNELKIEFLQEEAKKIQSKIKKLRK